MSNQYSPLPPPNGETYAYRELLDLARSLAEAKESVPLQILNAAPAKPRVGMIAYADGTNWDPSDGAGPYVYIGSTWTPLFTGGGGGGAVATDAIWDAKGDLAVGTGANTASKLTAGTNGKALIAASGEATGLKWGTLDEIAAPVASVSFNDQQATSFRIENRTSDPVSPTTGQIWLRTDL